MQNDINNHLQVFVLHKNDKRDSICYKAKIFA